MKPVHSSSLAFIPTGYVKPAQEGLIKKPANTMVSNTNDIDNRLQTPASTPDHVRSAINQSGLNNQPNFNHGDNSHSNKALKTYAETDSQPARAQLENMISRVDYYA